MADKDVTEKILESYNDVFADIVNVLLFDGEEVLKPDELVDMVPRAAYKADGQIREMERDVAKRWMKQNIRIACVGMENQTMIDPDMPLRVIGYDGAEYRAELNDKTRKERYPVVTLVLYFGYKRRWNKPKSLLECLDVPERFRPFVSDYKVNLFEIAYLSDAQVDKFQSDFRIVADYFVQLRKNSDYVASTINFDHVQETLQLLSVMTGDRTYEKLCSDPQKGVPRNMCEVLDKAKREGEAKGMARGMAEGMAKGMEQGEAAMAQLVNALLAQNRYEDLKRAAEDRDFRQKLFQELIKQ